MFEIEPGGESSGHCDCCGNQTHTIWGFVRAKGAAVASYFLQWTVNKSIETHPANFDLIYGLWGEGTSRSDRKAISLVHFENAGVPGTSIIDAATRPIAASELVGSTLKREEVVGTPLAREVFAIFDAVLVQDPRLS
jgi:hypothetical protein